MMYGAFCCGGLYILWTLYFKAFIFNGCEVKFHNLLITVLLWYQKKTFWFRSWKFSPVSVPVFCVGSGECSCVNFCLISQSLALIVIFRPLTFGVVSGKVDVKLLFGILFQHISPCVYFLLSHTLSFPFLTVCIILLRFYFVLMLVLICGSGDFNIYTVHLYLLQPIFKWLYARLNSIFCCFLSWPLHYCLVFTSIIGLKLHVTINVCLNNKLPLKRGKWGKEKYMWMHLVTACTVLLSSV